MAEAGGADGGGGLGEQDAQGRYVGPGELEEDEGGREGVVAGGVEATAPGRTEPFGLGAEAGGEAEAADEGPEGVVGKGGPAAAGESQGVDPGPPVGLGGVGLADGGDGGGMGPDGGEQAGFDGSLVGGEDPGGAEGEEFLPAGGEGALAAKVVGGEAVTAGLLGGNGPERGAARGGEGDDGPAEKGGDTVLDDARAGAALEVEDVDRDLGPAAAGIEGAQREA